MNRHVKLTIATPEGEVLDAFFVSVPQSNFSADTEVREVIVEAFECGDTLEHLIKQDAINAMEKPK
jgi:hypothetical protein